MYQRIVSTKVKKKKKTKSTRSVINNEGKASLHLKQPRGGLVLTRCNRHQGLQPAHASRAGAGAEEAGTGLRRGKRGLSWSRSAGLIESMLVVRKATRQIRNVHSEARRIHYYGQ